MSASFSEHGGSTCHDLESPTTEISKHESPYFEDGNIVLLSLPKDNTITAFKFYKEFFMVHSPVFKTMLSLPQPSNTAEYYDNAPVVRLHDEAEDLIPFLTAIYDPAYIPSKKDFYFSVDKVESTFRLCKKYACDNLMKCMQDVLCSIWPKHLASWDSIMNSELDKNLEQERVGLKEFFVTASLPDPCFSIHLAREYDVPAILPAAFYDITHRLPELFFARSMAGGPHDDGPLQPMFAYLSNDDLSRFIRGNYAIERFMNDVYSIASEIVLDCGTRHQCSEALLMIMKERHWKDVKDGMSDALHILNERNLMIDQYETDLCVSCRMNYVNLMIGHRQTLWNSLPAIFELGPDS